MNLHEVINKLGLTVCCGSPDMDCKVTGAYVSDLLSNVIATAKQGDVWITVQSHVNVVAVSVLKELAAVIIVQGREPAESTIQKAKEENVIILLSQQSAYQVAGKLYQIGVGALP